MNFLLRLIWTFSIINKVEAYSDGNFPEACDTLLPVHKFRGKLIHAQTSKPPFESEAVVTGPDLITVSLRSAGNAAFRGFMLEAQNKIDSHLVGTFIVLDSFREARLLTCNGSRGSAVSQTLNLEKRLFRVNWTSGVGDMGVIFRATFLQRFDEFWNPVNINVTSPPTPEPNTTPSTTPSNTPSTPHSTTPSTTPTGTTPSTTHSTTPSTTHSTTTSTTTSFTPISTTQITTESTLTSTTACTTPSIAQSATIPLKETTLYSAQTKPLTHDTPNSAVFTAPLYTGVLKYILPILCTVL